MQLGEGVEEAPTLAWLKARGIDPDEVWPIDPGRVDKLKFVHSDDVLEDRGLQIFGWEPHDRARGPLCQRK